MSLPGMWITATITSGTLSAAVDLGRTYDLLEIVMPALTSCDLSLHVCPTLGGTYTALSSVVQTVGTANYTEVFHCGFQYIKIKSSVSQTSKSFSVRGIAL